FGRDEESKSLKVFRSSDWSYVDRYCIVFCHGSFVHFTIVHIVIDSICLAVQVNCPLAGFLWRDENRVFPRLDVFACNTYSSTEFDGGWIVCASSPCRAEWHQFSEYLSPLNRWSRIINA